MPSSDFIKHHQTTSIRWYHQSWVHSTCNNANIIHYLEMLHLFGQSISSLSKMLALLPCEHLAQADTFCMASRLAFGTKMVLLSAISFCDFAWGLVMLPQVAQTQMKDHVASTKTNDHLVAMCCTKTHHRLMTKHAAWRATLHMTLCITHQRGCTVDTVASIQPVQCSWLGSSCA